jgi:glutaredoxin 3
MRVLNKEHAMAKRTVEVFSAGCPVCDEALEEVRAVVCESCDLQVHDMKTEPAQARARQYGIKRVPAVVVNGRLAECCRQGAVDIKTLQRLGVGQRA